MKTILSLLALCLAPLWVHANVAPTPVIVSAAMRPDSTIMDVVYRVNDPDDATVTVRALAFINGTRSFASLIKPTAFIEDTATHVGNDIATNTDHTLAWDVAEDWNIDVGQLKFEILALDSRGLFQFDWITIPAVGENPALTISKDTPASDKLLDTLFWQHASGDPWMELSNGILRGTAASGNFSGLELANGASPNSTWAPLYLFKLMNLDPANAGELAYANTTARADILNTGSWHATTRSYMGFSRFFGWGYNGNGQLNVPPTNNPDIVAIAAGTYHSLILKSDGTVVGLGLNTAGQITIPKALIGVTAIAAGGNHSLALKSDGTVIGWGNNDHGQVTIPGGLSGVTAIAAGRHHSLALKNDGTVIGWGDNAYGQVTIPNDLTGVTAVAAGGTHSLVLKEDGTVIGWGNNNKGQITIPGGLTEVVVIAAGGDSGHSLAIKSDGTVIGWGDNTYGAVNIPGGLTGVTALAAGGYHSLALKSDGSVIGWGYNAFGQITIPGGLTGVTAIAAGDHHSIAMKAKTL